MSRTRTLLLAVTALMVTGWSATARAEAADTAEQKAVLITGASSGIGRNIAETLASKDYFVYAGARNRRIWTS